MTGAGSWTAGRAAARSSPADRPLTLRYLLTQRMGFGSVFDRSPLGDLLRERVFGPRDMRDTASSSRRPQWTGCPCDYASRR
jgi:hypothetical protein